FFVQRLLGSNADLKSPLVPGNLFMNARRFHLVPCVVSTVQLELTELIPAEEFPPENDFIKYVKIQSDLLSRFHGRPIYLRAGIILPKDYTVDENRRFPLRIHIGGYGARYTAVERLMGAGSDFRRMWLSSDTPR